MDMFRCYYKGSKEIYDGVPILRENTALHIKLSPYISERAINLHIVSKYIKLFDYRIWPNYHTVGLGFFKNYWELRIHFKNKSSKDLFDEVYAIFFSDFLYKSIMLWVLI